MKKALALLLVAVMALTLFAACGKKVDPEAILGTWKVESIEGKDEANEQLKSLIGMGAELLFIFDEDGTYEFKATFMGKEQVIESGTYKLKNDRLSLSSMDGSTKVTVKDETHLQFKGDDITMNLTKK